MGIVRTQAEDVSWKLQEVDGRPGHRTGRTTSEPRMTPHLGVPGQGGASKGGAWGGWSRSVFEEAGSESRPTRAPTVGGLSRRTRTHSYGC